MILRGTIPILVACSCLSPIAAQKNVPNPSKISPSSTSKQTQDFSEVVLPIASVKITPSVKLGLSGRPGPTLNIGARFGTGFCLDAGCRFIVTNYHVAMMTPAHKIKGDKIIRRYFATGPKDEDATPNLLGNSGVFPFATDRDLAIFELRDPLPQHHGLSFSLDELQAGQQVDIYGYPAGSMRLKRKLTRFPAIYKAPTTSGLLAFDYQLPADEPLRIRGASGGIVVDRKTEKIVGILSGTTQTMAIAVPVQTLADFVSKVEPFLAANLFPASMLASPLPGDFYPKLAPTPDSYPKFVPTHVNALQHRREEPFEVTVLRKKAQCLADSMRDFIAVQTFAWGSANKEPAAEAWYEVRVIDGVQRFRQYPDGKKELEHPRFPHLSGWVVPSNIWSELPTMVGTELRLKVQQSPDIVVNGRRLKVFQYYAGVEDNLCPFKPIIDFGLFTVGKTVAVACYGEVWTDQDTNIVRMSEHLDLFDRLKAYRGWKDIQVVLTYGWLRRAHESSRLVPLTVFTGARDKKHIYWCRGQFMQYKVFSARARLMTNSPSAGISAGANHFR